ncbi:hypothetical protein Pcar_1532 [Syntrophotalea carbinolica DSM 2380]|uniref:Uncharacterized protein n=1 Tax=Syntrophotalea carbinolica (strain DSM 2380 / NBRC 103641 / GraBd1) TaxID=338963 RepID=Q3A4D0_SYNC1|nr:hypothetical protein [Syntrophotalea carbinolica]ABA88777.1 hypothetical protein Pcar_1532 [Syntrophotalea carbinolica DSM 2380]
MCQVKHIHEMGCKRPLRLKIEQFVLSTLITLKIPLIRKKMRKSKTCLMNYLGKHRSPSLTKKASKQLPSLDLKAGDIVRVRSKEQIRQTLDENGRLGGCAFLDEMWQYCGGEYAVVKKMEHFFDEASVKMRKSRDLVLLDGIHCSGQGIPIFKHACDRYCLLFWKEAWLEKVE